MSSYSSIRRGRRPSPLQLPPISTFQDVPSRNNEIVLSDPIHHSLSVSPSRLTPKQNSSFLDGLGRPSSSVINDGCLATPVSPSMLLPFPFRSISRQSDGSADCSMPISSLLNSSRFFQSGNTFSSFTPPTTPMSQTFHSKPLPLSSPAGEKGWSSVHSPHDETSTTKNLAVTSLPSPVSSRNCQRSIDVSESRQRSPEPYPSPLTSPTISKSFKAPARRRVRFHSPLIEDLVTTDRIETRSKRGLQPPSGEVISASKRLADVCGEEGNCSKEDGFTKHGEMDVSESEKIEHSNMGFGMIFGEELFWAKIPGTPLFTTRMQKISMELSANLAKGLEFTKADFASAWIAYRRNYFYPCATLKLPTKCLLAPVRRNVALPIESFHFSIGARSLLTNLPVSLIQYSARREHGPCHHPIAKEVQLADLVPSKDEAGMVEINVEWERVQWGQATGGNGTTATDQEYFVLEIRVMAICEGGMMVDLGTIESGGVIVRGRSKIHYISKGASSNATKTKKKSMTSATKKKTQKKRNV